MIRIKSPSNEYHEERSELYITALSDHDVIFGTDWLQAHNPEVDWVKPQLAFTRCPKSCKLSQKPLVLEPKSKESHTTVISRIEPLEEYHAVKVETTDPELFACIHQWDKENYVHVRSKSTTSTELAARTAPHPSMSTIPDKYWSFTKVFSEEASHRLLAHRPWDHAIDLIPGKTMKNSGIYRLMPSESAALKEYITEHLWKGFIRPSSSSMASPFFFVDKKDGKLQPVQDYRKLNEITVKNAAPLLLIPDLVDKLQGAQYFTKLDVRWGYNNIRIKEGDEYKAAFKTVLGLNEPLVMTFGLCNAPVTFQTFTNQIFEDLLDTGQVIIYLDDILIFTHTIDQLDRLTCKVLEHLECHDLFLKPKKCFFDQKSIEYLGVIISEGQVKMDQAKVHGILNWPTPKTLKNVQAFLGFCNFYRRFVQDFSALVHPLSQLTKKDTLFVWGDTQEKVFKALITAFTTAPVLALPDHTKPFQLITDASAFATGAILEQPDVFNRWHPIVYYSKSLQPTGTEQNYEIHDLELLAIIQALETFRHYLEGRDDTLKIWLDHGNLVYFTTKQKLSCCQACWALYLSHFKFIIIHKPGAYNKADALSHCPDLKEGMAHDNEERVLLNTKIFSARAVRATAITSQGDVSLRERLKKAQTYDTEVSQALASIVKNGPRSVTKGLEDWNLENGIILFRRHVYVPKDISLRKDIVKSYYDYLATGHPRHWKSYELVS